MSLAKRILDEANEDITTTELYGNVKKNIPIVIEGLKVLSNEFENANSKTEVEDWINFGDTIKAVQAICDELDKNGFTYFPQPTNFQKRQFKAIFDNFIEFYEGYVDGFAADDIEILNTNSKDLLSILEKLQ